LWLEKGLLSITGGKLTTFRTTALEVLHAVRQALPDMGVLNPQAPILTAVKPPAKPLHMDAQAFERLYARYGQLADQLLAQAQPEDCVPIDSTDYLWAELPWVAAHEGVIHLQDLMLRRTRLGFLLRDGGQAFLPRIRELCQPVLGWDDADWTREENDYCQQWRKNYAPPAPSTPPAQQA
jgi:glycerol-3-phosphate dehydrogenase